MATATTQQFGIRVGLDGGKAVEAGLEAIAQAGMRAMTSVERSGIQASAALERATRSANDNAGAVGRLGGSFDRFESQAKAVGRSVSDVSGALTTLGGAGTAADRAIVAVRSTIGGIADIAGTAAVAFGAGGAGLVGALTRVAGVVGIAVTAFQAFNLITRAVTGSSEDAAKAQKDLDEAYRRLAHGAETAEERQARLREETLRGIQADLDRVRSVETLNAALAQTATESARGRFRNVIGQIVEEEQIQAAAGERVTAVQRARLEGLRTEARAIAQEIEAGIGRISGANSGIARATAQAAAARSNALPQFGPPIPPGLGRGGGAVREARAEAGALEESLNRLAAAAGQVRIPTEQLDRARAIIEATTTPAERYASTLAELDTLLASGAISQETFSRAVTQAQASLDKADGSAKALADTGRQLGLTFSSAFEDAIVRGRELSEVLKGVLQDIARIIVRQTITNPLANAATSAISGLAGSLFGGGVNAGTTAGGAAVRVGASTVASGASIASLSLPFGGARAEGGPVTPGNWYMVGERGPEPFIPAVPGRIAPSAVAAGAPVINQTVSIDLRGSELTLAQVDARVRAGMKAANAELLDAYRRGGATRAVLRR